MSANWKNYPKVRIIGEHTHGKFSCSVQLQKTVDVDKVKTIFKNNGVLHFTLPRIEQVKTWKIAAKVVESNLSLT